MTAPIYEMLKAYGDRKPIPFHMPGHLLGRGLPSVFKEAGRFDITEISGSDNLHAPEGVIKEAQELAARCFGADYTLFLVNGSTSGIHTMIHSTIKPGDKLIIGRDCHKSVLNALAMLNAHPVFVMPQIDDESQIPLGITEENVEKALSANPDARGILITRPNYYGIATKVEGLAALAKRHGIPLMVDEAHGAHFCFSRHFPKPAMAAGADLCVQSLHKTLPALTQTALLHGKGNCVERRAVETVASMVQTTSPSYLLMASIDKAREMMENEGGSLYEALMRNLEYFDGELAKKTAIQRVTIKRKDMDTDFSRVVLSFRQTLLNGYEAAQLLMERYGIVAEMADMYHVVLIATPYHGKRDFDRLLSALQEISGRYKADRPQLIGQSYSWEMPERVMPLREAIFSEKREIPLHEAVGCVSATAVIPYPPCIPVLNPGERITQNLIDYIRSVIALDSSVHGVENDSIQIVDTNDKRG